MLKVLLLAMGFMVAVAARADEVDFGTDFGFEYTDYADYSYEPDGFDFGFADFDAGYDYEDAYGPANE